MKSQIILSCSSARLRWAVLKDSEMTLWKQLDAGRIQALSDKQAAGIETTRFQKKLFAVQIKSFQSQKHPPQKIVKCKNVDTWRTIFTWGSTSTLPSKRKNVQWMQKIQSFSKVCRSQSKYFTPMAVAKHSQQRPKHKVHQVQKQTEQQLDTPDSSAENDYVYIVSQTEHKH